MSAIKKISVDSELYNIEDSRVDNIAEQIPDASTETKGLVQIGEGITVSDGVISVDAALPIEVVPEYEGGTLIATISQGENEWLIYAPQGGQGDTVTYSSAPQTGTTKLLGTLTINNVPYYINEEAVVVSDTLNAGTTIATITCGNQSWTIKAPAETDPIFLASPAANISAADITAWNNKSDFSGNYNDLTNKPVIPTATSNLVNDSGFITSAQAGDTVSYNQTLGSGVQIGTITINGNTTTIYAPSGGSPSGGDTVGWSGNYTSSTGTQIGTLTISGVNNPIYGPNPGDTVAYSASVATGTVLGTLTIDGTTHTIYAPTVPSNVGAFTNDAGYVTSANVTTQMENELAGVAFTGSYENLADVPEDLSDFNNDTGFITSAALADYVTSADIADCLTSADVSVTQVTSAGTKIATITVDNTSTDLYAPTGGGGGGGADWAATSTESGYIANKPSMASGTGINAVIVAMDEDIAASGDYSFAANKSIAAGNYSHAEGKGAVAMGEGSHAEGEGVVSSRDNDLRPYISAGLGIAAHAEGGARATGKYAHAEGKGYALLSIAENPGSGAYIFGNAMAAHAEGASTASGSYSHAEGYDCEAYGAGDHAEGFHTQANSYVPNNQSATTGVVPNWPQHVEGQYNVKPFRRDQTFTVTGNNKKFIFANIIGNGNGEGSGRSNAAVTTYSGDQYLSGDLYVNCTDYVVTSAGFNTANCGGTKVLTSADVDWNIISNKPSVEKGTGTGAVTIAGFTGYTSATGMYSVAEGKSKATGNYAHAEGFNTIANANQAHAEGSSCDASGLNAHAEGDATHAIGQDSHAEGCLTYAQERSSHAEGWKTEINTVAGHVQGKYNIVDNNGIFLDIVGNGADNNSRSNAEATDINGNKYIAGGLWLRNSVWTTTSAGVAANGIRIDYCDSAVVDPSTATYPEDGYGVLASYQGLTDDGEGGWYLDKSYTSWYSAANLVENGLSKLPSCSIIEGTYYDNIYDHVQAAPYNYDGGTWVLKAFCYISHYEDDGSGNWMPVYMMKYEWVKESDTTPWDEPEPEELPPSADPGDEPEPDPEEPIEENPEGE